MVESYEQKSDLRVEEFYDGKSIFITGAAGSFGTILLECLLRCCPGIRAIYLLLRAKKGIEPEARKEIIFNKSIFDMLKITDPAIFDKVHIIAGDVSLPDLGMKRDDFLKICQNVTIVFHSAASVNFLKPYRFMITQNALATSYVIELCRKLKKLDVLIFTSTAFSNSNRKTEIREMVYRLPFPAQMFLEQLNHGTEDSLDELITECKPEWPNSYTFSKAVAENIIMDMASDLPIGVIRPSIITSFMGEPHKGYMEDSGLMAFYLGIGKGFIRVMRTGQNFDADSIPADIVANAHIVAAWSIATRRSQTPLVINCVSSGDIPMSLSQFADEIFKRIKKRPIPKSFQKPTTIIKVKNPFLHKIVTAYQHYLPAYVIDCFLRINGKKPRIVKLYKYLDKVLASLEYFLNNVWIFHKHNFTDLSKHLDEDGKKTFNMSLEGIDLVDFGETILSKTPAFLWDSDEKMLVHRQTLQKRYMLITSIKIVALFCICLMFYLFYVIIFSRY